MLKQFKPSLRNVGILVFVIVIAAVGYLTLRNSHATGADINNDNKVDAFDLAIIALNYNQTGKTYAQGDITGDGSVNVLDLSALASSWGNNIVPPPQPSFPIRAMFYYPWFPEAWNQQGFNPFSNYTPTAGLYSSTDTATINRQIDDMIYAGMNSAVYSWWGQASKEDNRFQAFLDATGTKPLKWALYYECEGNGSGGTCGTIGGPAPSATNIANDLAYIKSHYTANGNYLKINNKPAIFVYGDGSDSCATATNWKTANAAQGFYVILKVFGGYATCADQPDNWHQYGPATAQDAQGTHSFSISPGYWKKGCPQVSGGTCTQGGTQPYLARDLTRWNTNVTALKNSNANLELVTTYNEWGEGSIVESANGTLPDGWQSASGHGQFIDALHQVLVSGTPIDNPPAVSLTAPTAGNVSGNVTLSANSSDDNGVSKVEFLVDGTVVNTDTTSPYSFVWNSLTVANGTHTITARATDTINQQTTSTGVSVSVLNDSTAPTIPTGLSATATSPTQVNLSWNASTDSGGSGLAKYEISRGGIILATINAPSTTYSDTTVSASTTYSYTVKAIDGAGNKSAASTAATVTTPANNDITPPTIPGAFTASLPVSTDKTVNLNWTSSTDTGGSGLKNYILSRNGTVIATPAANATSFSDTTTVYSTNYTYTIAAVDNATNTSGAATATITTPAAPADTQAPDVPTATASVVSATQVTISWNTVADNPKTGGTASGVKGYRVFRDGVQIADVLAPSTSTNDGPFNFVSGQSYAYKVLAYDVAGNASAQSAASSVIPNPVIVSGNRCGNAATGNKIDTVIVISEENHTWGDVGGVGFGDPAMPYTHALAAQCGVFQLDSEINFSENSLTQYIGGWAGVNNPNGISNDCSPTTSCSYSGNNIQRVFRNAGIPSKSYVEGATTGCSASGNAVRHIPEMYMWDPVDKAACSSEVRPLTEFNWGSPPTGFTFITPNLCNDGHDCGNSTVDGWLSNSARLPALFNSTAYKTGKVFVQLWWDEDHPKPNLFACWTCHQFNSAIDPHYSGESLLWLNLLGAPTTNLGGISTGTDIRSIVGTP